VWIGGLEAARDRSRGLLLEGPPGIGKTHLWHEAIASAEAAGFRILRTQPAPAEVRLVGAALIDLCDEISDAELAALPDVQSDALGSALLRRRGSEDTANPHAVALAVTTLIRELARNGPLLVCIDDMQWLDPQTADVLRFVVRRLPQSGVGVLMTVRTEPGGTTPDLVTDIAAGLPLTRQTVAPLTATDLERVIRATVGSDVSTAVLRAAVDAAGGNPLFGIEVARTLTTTGTTPTGAPVPLPSSLAELVGRHLSELPAATQTCLATAAALRRPTLGDLRRLGVADALAAAEHAGLIRLDGRDVAFTQPVYAAAAYDQLTTTERMALHSRLAGIVTDEEERARHLALSAEDPDEAIAAALDVARDRALARGAVHAALDASELALSATPPQSPQRAARQIQLGRMLFRVGESDRAREQLAAAAEGADEALVKARALLELARVVADTQSELDAVRLEFEALSLAAGDNALIADIHMGLAMTRVDDWQAAVEHARTALSLLDADPSTDPRTMATALCSLVGPSFYLGAGADVDACRRAIELEAGSVSVPVSDRAISILSYLQLWTDDFPAARKQLALAYQLCVEEGDEASRAYTLSNMALLELRAGNWTLTDSYLAECLDLFQSSRNEYFARVAQQQRLWLAVYRGEYDEALAAAEADVETGLATSNPLLELRGRSMRGFCALVRGDAALAATELDRYRALFAVNNAGEPALRQVAGDHLEALVAVGRLDDAQAALDDLVTAGERLNRTAVLATAARAQALLLAARGDAAGAAAAIERSLELYDKVERRFDRARALLTKGQIHRRFKQKAAAREALTRAYEEFEELGARAFAERAKHETGRVGVRVAESLDLTETERRIADLTAQGHTSAEIAAAMFLSTKTVSANLTKIYRKLGVRNRAELTALLAKDRTGP
jgi:DNA-binding CsgD family transcriptional regulator